MTDAKTTLAQAQMNSTAARARVSTSLGLVQQKLDPKRIAKRAVRDVAEIGTSAAEASVETARRYPATLAAIATGLGLFLARHRIARLARTATRRRDTR